VSANLYCWVPNPDLNPTDRASHDKIDALHQAPTPPRSARLVAFVAELLTRYRDLTETEDTVWADGPLVGNIIGEFINMGLIWSRYEEAVPFVIEIAHKHGLHCYDPQSGDFFPVPA
jgi:hypothetical protein